MRKNAKTTILVAALAASLLLLAGAAEGGKKKMRSTSLGKHLCETSGGGKIVGIPGFPGERIDRRLLADIRWMKRRWNIFITDGYSDDPVHSVNGEHPLGLALDIVPDKAAGGTWKQIDRLAAWAEPRPNRPRAPFRWVGYDGDSGHGRGHHLHLSWNHSPTKPFRRARTVQTVRCPDAGPRKKGGGKTGGGGSGGSGGKNGGDSGGGSGGVEPGDGSSGGSGGIGLRRTAPGSVESGGIGLR
jgi:hypothetical protein